MKQTLRQAFKNITESDPPLYLEGAILHKIEIAKEKQAKIKISLSYAGLGGSFIFLFCIVAVFGNSFLESEFWSIVSLAYYDASIVAGNWNDFVFSLLETFPVINTIAISLSIIIVLLSLDRYLLNKRKYQKYYRKSLSFNI